MSRINDDLMYDFIRHIRYYTECLNVFYTKNYVDNTEKLFFKKILSKIFLIVAVSFIWL